ncbi:MAG: FixH family protein [Rhodoferax sp.]|uniref:FixH family protein n=1 Tax=Rhodoferax sp. TaxID=50421 RepID=UPI00260F67E9|nr:FixH family protein [Rhodoferax sp.]MDD2882357.1 FixH family protein [Rhodoferax sp.]
MQKNDELNQKWWQFGHVWLVIGLPAVVVVASFITLYLAMSRPNEIISDDSYQPSRQSDQSIEARRKESSMAPAMLGRNHAQTGIVPPPK